MLLWDQIASWILVALCLWLVHQTAGVNIEKDRGRFGFALMRWGIAALGISVAVVTTFRIFGTVFIAGGIWKTALNVILLGVVLFHKNRFNKL